MKKHIIMIIFFTSILAISACTSEEADEKDRNDKNTQEESQNNNGKDGVRSDEWADDDMGLGIRDTGLSDSHLGKQN